MLLHLVHGGHKIDLAAFDRIFGALGQLVVIGLHHGAQVPLGLSIPLFQIVCAAFCVLMIDGARINPFKIRTYFLRLPEFLGHICVLEFFDVALVLTVFFRFADRSRARHRVLGQLPVLRLVVFLVFYLPVGFFSLEVLLKLLDALLVD